ncbi:MULTISPECIES: PucR family transcriptional regulator [Microbacterium]|uniref:PucR family transcriptional regulator n=1 Tax=Microbacterium profundi TaxID=450380 RepID=A0ABV3LEE0_9MICO|nr:PucR family transcriptional regulator [Microbacterium sp. KRD172]
MRYPAGESPDLRDPSAVRVADLLAWNEPRVALVGEMVGLDRVIRWSLPSDLVDPSPYLRGDELVLTAGISIVDVATQRKFVESVCAAGAAVIGFALGVVADEVPPALIGAANALGVAVLSIPADVAFVEITQRLANEQNRHQLEARERSRVGAIVDMVRRGQASSQVLKQEFGARAESIDTVGVVVARRIAWPIDDAVLKGDIGQNAVAVFPGEKIAGMLSAAREVGLPFGWSGPVGFDRAATAVREAFAAVEVSSRLGRAAGPRDLATWHGLVHRLTPDQLAPFVDHVIAPLREYDLRHRTQLLLTAEVLCHRDGAVPAAAAELYVHENTVRKRVVRIEGLTGLNPLNSLDRAALLVALVGRHA